MNEVKISRLYTWIGILHTVRAILILLSVATLIYGFLGNGFIPALEVLILTILITIPLALIRRKHDRLEAANLRDRNSS